MQSRPRILVTSGRINIGGSSGYSRVSRSGCSMAYTESVLAAGGLPLMLPLMRYAEIESQLPELADGIILTGGGDISPLEYGQEPKPYNKGIDPTRDALDLAVARAAMARGIPLLCICRGIQVFNVACGGTLIQDIGAEVPHSLQHDIDCVDPVFAHTIDIVPGSKLAAIMGGTTILTNSYHHQAVAEPGKGLTVVAKARDGVIEAVEAADSRPVIGVQFHPEEQSNSAALFPKLFDWVVEEARRHRNA